jgi:hypothetical protein
VNYFDKLIDNERKGGRYRKKNRKRKEMIRTQTKGTVSAI